MQVIVQGAWARSSPAHLNELCPTPGRAIMPGFAYQPGNLLSSRNESFSDGVRQQPQRHRPAGPTVALSG